MAFLVFITFELKYQLIPMEGFLLRLKLDVTSLLVDIFFNNNNYYRAVIIGYYTVVGTGSMLTKNLDSKFFYVGSPSGKLKVSNKY